MRRLGQLTLLIALLSIGCQIPPKTTDSLPSSRSVLSKDSFLAACQDHAVSTMAILERYLPSVEAMQDTATYYYGDVRIEEDSIWRQILIGKLVDAHKVIATEVVLTDSSIRFYALDSAGWRGIGDGKLRIPYYRMQFEDLDGDGNNEIIASTCRNMNGNAWMEVYYASKEGGRVHYAGDLTTNYVVHAAQQQIEVRQEASGYLDHLQIVFEWRQERLIPMRQIVRRATDGASFHTQIVYYENPTGTLGGLTERWVQPLKSQNPAQDRLWDDFFTRK